MAELGCFAFAQQRRKAGGSYGFSGLSTASTGSGRAISEGAAPAPAELPCVPEDAPSVQVFYEGSRRHQGERRLALNKDILGIAAQPGEAEDSLVLSGAQVSVQGECVSVDSRHARRLVLQCENAAAAEKWAAKLRDASQFAERAYMRSAAQVNTTHRRHTERVAMLESRVNATMQAAVSRQQRINDLQAALEGNKDRDHRIKELEMAVQESNREVSLKTDRVKELEAALENGGMGGAGGASMAIMDQAVSKFDLMIGDREEHMLPGSTVWQLKQAMDAVRSSNSTVPPAIAELIGTLVEALRWPMALRQRLADSERTVKEQKMLVDESKAQLEELSKRLAIDQDARRAAEEQVSSLKTLLDKAESAAEEAVSKLSSLENASHIEELQMLQEQRQKESQKRQEAEGQARELKDRLQFIEEMLDPVMAEEQAVKLRERLRAAESSLEEAGKRQRVLDAAHEDELRNLRGKLEDSEDSQKAIAAEAADLREKLEERKAIGDVEKDQELEELRAQQKQNEARRAQLDSEMETLREALKVAEQSTDETVERHRSELVSRHGEELQKLYEQVASATDEKTRLANEANALREHLRKTQALTVQSHSDTQSKLVELQKKLEDAERRAEDAALHQKRVEDEAYAEELKAIQQKFVDAEEARNKAQSFAAELKNALTAAESSAREAAEKQVEDLKATHNRELEDLQRQRAVAQDRERDVESKLAELRGQLESAEGAKRDATDQSVREAEERRAQVQLLEGQQEVAESEKKRVEAQMLDLETRLAAAQKLAEQAQLRTLAIDDASEKELTVLREKQAEAERRLLEAAKETEQLKADLQASVEVASTTDAEAQQHQEQMRLQHEQQLEALYMERQAAEEQRRHAEVLLLQAKMEVEAVSREKDQVQQSYLDSVESLRAQQKEMEDRRSAAEAEAAELRVRLNAAEQDFENSQASSSQERAVLQEQLAGLKFKQLEAEQQAEEATVRLEDMGRKLLMAEASADESTRRQVQMLEAASTIDAQHEEETAELHRKHQESEAKRLAAEQQVVDLKKRLIAATRMAEQVSAQNAQEGSDTGVRMTASAIAFADDVQDNISSSTKYQRQASDGFMSAASEHGGISPREAEAAESGAKEGDSPEAVQVTLEHWLAAADQAAEKLKEVKQMAVEEEFRSLSQPAGKATLTKKELEDRLRAAELEVGKLQKVAENQMAGDDNL
eukprot:TRINITY_DN74262_c0_g1_i1.p1 TRINITY_DN74262_c0_g1~~TRINITY_DN74262_c0_g1_i1.p1  ORF type:complete len:1203 (+),score=552.50 TRINITY_DN74262_c0_g1_i1:126-3734(+)